MSYLFCHQFGNFPLRAIFLPIQLLPSDINEDFNYLYNKYGDHFNMIDETDYNIIRIFEMLADGSPTSYDMLFGVNSFEMMEVDIPEYFKESIIYYDNVQNRKDFNIELMESDKDDIEELYNILKTKHSVIRSILYKS